jgi:hypothetical protein
MHFFTKLSKILGIRDPGCGGKKGPDPRSGSVTLLGGWVAGIFEIDSAVVLFTPWQTYNSSTVSIRRCLKS